MKAKIAIALILAASCANAEVSRLSDNELNFYSNKIPAKSQIIKLSGKNDLTDSKKLNQLMAEVSKKGGGTIIIPAGTYYLKDVQMKSNIHLKIEPAVKLYPVSPKRPNDRLQLFDFGDLHKIENVALTSTVENSQDPKDWFSVTIPKDQYVGGARFIKVGFAENFKIDGMWLNDNFSKFSAIALNMPESKKRTEIARNGIIKNVWAQDGNVGYGAVQMQTGFNVLYKNIGGEGGVTLRVETGATETNRVNEKCVDNVVIRNVTIKNGDAAFNMSPHRVDQGRVDAQGITAINSTHAVQIAAGFLDKKQGVVDNIGTFDSRSYFGDITVMGGAGAQVKTKDFAAYSCAEQIEMAKNPNLGTASFKGRSIAAVRDSASKAAGCNGGADNGCYEVNLGKITKLNSNFVKSSDFNYYKLNKPVICKEAAAILKAAPKKKKSKKSKKSKN